MTDDPKGEGRQLKRRARGNRAGGDSREVGPLDFLMLRHVILYRHLTLCLQPIGYRDSIEIDEVGSLAIESRGYYRLSNFDRREV